MINSFKEKGASGVVLLFVLSVIVHFHSIFSPPTVVHTTNNYLIDIVLRAFDSIPSALLLFIYQGIIIIQALRLNLAFNRLEMFDKEDNTVAMTYILLTGLIPSWSNISAPLLMNFLLILTLPFFKSLSEKTKPENQIFTVSLLFSFGIMFYPPFFPFILLAILIISSIKSLTLKRFYLFLLGILLPYYFLGGILFLQDKWQNFKTFLPQFEVHKLQEHWTQIDATAFMYMGILFILGLYYFQSHSHKLNFWSRKIWGTLFIQLLLPVASVFLMRTNGRLLEMSALALIPCSSYIANAFHYERKRWIANAFFWLTIIIIFYTQSGHAIHFFHK